MKIYGIRCDIDDMEQVKVIRQVLKQIKERKPKDFQRLKSRIQYIGWLPDGEDDGLTTGLVFKKELDEYTGTFTLCTVHFARWLERLEAAEQRGTIAHELGHAAARVGDFTRRGCCAAEWQDELTADWYAYRWGYGPDIREKMKSRFLDHHCVGPGESFEYEGKRFEVTRNFVIRRIYPDPPLTPPIKI